MLLRLPMVMLNSVPMMFLTRLEMTFFISSNVSPLTFMGPMFGNWMAPSLLTVRLYWPLILPQTSTLTSSPGPTT